MRSTTFASAEQLPTVAPHDSAVVLRTTATFPPEFARLVVPLASGIGSAPPTAAAEASCTRKNLPGWTVPLSGVTCQLVPEAEAYWIDHAPRSTALTAVEELDEVVRVRRTAVAAAAVDLADDHVG